MQDPQLLILAKALDLCGQMSALSEEGMASCRDDGCMVVYGILRDCAYRVQDAASAELKVHAAEIQAGVAERTNQSDGGSRS